MADFKGLRIQSSGTEVVTTTNSSEIDTSNADTILVKATVDVDTPSAITEAAANWNTSDIITSEAHGFTTGLVGQVTSAGTKPTGISLATDYYIGVIDADTFYLFDTLAHALAYGADSENVTGKVNITNVGSGDHTFTPTALAGGSIKLQYAINAGQDVWGDVPDTTESVTADGSFTWELPYIYSEKYRVQSALTSGRFNVIADAKVRLV